MTTSDIQLCTLYTQSYLFKMKNVTMSSSCLSTLGTTHCFRINFEIRTAADKTLHALTSYRSCSSHKALLPSAPQSIAPWHLKAPCSLLPWPLPIPGTFSPAFQTPLPALAPYSRSGFRLIHHFLGRPPTPATASSHTLRPPHTSARDPGSQCRFTFTS